MPGLDAPFTRPLRQLSEAHALFAAEGRTPSRDAGEMLAWYRERQREEWKNEQSSGAAADSGGRSSLGRRAFLGAAAATAAGTVLATAGRAAAAPIQDIEPVIIVGAGLAGMTCAYRLSQQGIPVRVYEAQERIGGRCWTIRGKFDHGATGEHGGQWIDSRHRHIRALAEELGLPLIDTFAQEPPSSGPSYYWLDGAHRTSSEVFAGYGDFYAALKSVYKRIGSYLYDEAGEAAKRFDQRTSLEWLDANVANPLLRLALENFETGFWGIETAEMSAINLLESNVAPYPGANERYRVFGGNDSIISAIEKKLPAGTVVRGRPLIAAKRRKGGRIELTFDGQSDSVLASQVVLALPFTTLRDVDYAGLQVEPRRDRAIKNLAMGTNAKFYLQFDQPYSASGFGDFFVTDDPSKWYAFDTEKDQDVPDHNAPLLLIYSGGDTGKSYRAYGSEGPASGRTVAEALEVLDRGSTGNPPLSSSYNGNNYLVTWVNNPWVHGSYAGFGPGQYTDFWGYLKTPEPGLYFAGEHTSTHSQGYLNGGVQSGQRAATQVLQRLS